MLNLNLTSWMPLELMTDVSHLTRSRPSRTTLRLPIMSTTTTSTLHTTESGNTISVTPTSVWQPLPIEGQIPAPYTTPKFGLEVKPLHPTFACELSGVDWSKPIPPEVYAEIREVCDKVRHLESSLQAGFNV